jgi:hypothetical protein
MLKLEGGFHVGPLFEIRKRRPVIRAKGKIGIIHRAQTKRATPPWLDLRLIAPFYKEARRKSRETGVLFVVDHIVPKISPIVCGLHVPWNLRVIHWRENVQKGNAWWPDMPNEQLQLFEDEP